MAKDERKSSAKKEKPKKEKRTMDMNLSFV